MHWDTAIAKIFAFWALMLALLCAGIHGGIAHAAPAPAGTNIANTASATYIDGNGVPRTATSNTVVTVVQQVKSFTLTNSQGKIAAAGQQVCYPHTITNTGNGVDTYSLVPALSTPIGSPPQFVHQPVIAYYFDNGNGQPTGSAITATTPLNAGAQFQFVLCATVPLFASNGDTGVLTARVSDTSPASVALPTTNTDTTTVSSSAITVVKSLSSTAPPNVLTPVPSGPSPNGNGQVGAVASQLFIVLSYANAGASAATNLALSDNLPAGMLYVPNSGRWSGSGLAAMGDSGPDPAGINYSAPSSLAGGTINATIANVPATGSAGASGYVYFEIAIPPLRLPTDLTNVAETTNTARFTTTQNPTPTPTNPVTYVVSPKRGVVANNTNASNANRVPNNTVNPVGSPTGGTPLTASGAGQTIYFEDFVWNTGNTPDTFDITLPSNTFPPGTVFTLLRADGSTPLTTSDANSTPDTGVIPPGGFVKVIVRATLPINAATAAPAGNVANGGPGYQVTLLATSSSTPTLSDPVNNFLPNINLRTVDLTATTPRSDSAPAGAANAGNAATTGFGPNNLLPVVNTNATPLPTVRTNVIVAPLYINNTSAVADTFTLSAPTLPPGWTSEFRLPNASGSCTEPPVLGAVTNATGSIAANANTIMCLVVSVPPTTSGQAAPGPYPLPITVTSTTTPGLSDTLIQQVTLATVHNVTLTPPNAQNTVPGGIVTYSHVLTNLGNVDEPIVFNGAFNTNNLPGWTSTVYLDDGDGVIEIGGDDIVITPNAAGLFTLPKATLNLGNTRSIWVRVTAPTTPVSDPPPTPNITTVTATYFGGPLVTTDATSLNEGVSLRKYQQLVSCTATPSVAFSSTTTPNIPDAPWTTLAVGSVTEPASAPGQCIAYLVVAANVSGRVLTGVQISDTVPVGGPATVQTSCGVAAAGAPGSTPIGAVGANAVGSITTVAPTLPIAAKFHLRFCVQINRA